MMEVTTGNPVEKSSALRWLEDWQQTQADSTNQTKEWANSIQPSYDRLFRLIESGVLDHSAERLQGQLTELAAMRNTVVNQERPVHVSLPYWHLDNAYDDVLSSLGATLEHKDETATAYLRAAQIELGFFELELFRLGASVS